MSSWPNSSTAFRDERLGDAVVRSGRRRRRRSRPSIAAAASAARSRVEVVHEHARAVGAQELRRRAADATRRAGDDRRLARPAPSFAQPPFVRARIQAVPRESRIAAMSAPTGRSLTQGDVLWTPPPDARERFVARALPRVAAQRARPRLRRLRRALALVGHRSRRRSGPRSGTSSRFARTRRTSACSARGRCPAPSGSRGRG